MASHQLAALELDYKRRHYPNVPPNGSTETTFSGDTANDLPHAIIRCIELHGGYAVRINIQSQYDVKLGKWVLRENTVDIQGVMNGIHLSIKIKIGCNTVSDAQKQTVQNIVKAGGLFFVAHGYDSFYHFFGTYILTIPRPQASLYHQRHPIPHLATPDLPKIKFNQ